MKIGRKRLRQMRERYHMSRTEFAAMMGVEAEQIAAWESGHGKPADEEGADNILQLFWHHPITMAQFALIGAERIAHKVGARFTVAVGERTAAPDEPAP